MLKVCVLLQGLMLAAWCDVWPRDQELKDGEDEQFQHTSHQHRGGWDHGDQYGYSGTGHDSAGTQKESSEVSGTVHYPLDHGHVNPSHEHPSEHLSVDREVDSAETPSNKTPTRMG